MPYLPFPDEVPMTSRSRSVINDETNVRDIYRPQWAGLTKTEVVWAGLERLKAHNFIRITQKETGGRQAEMIEINPASKRIAA